MLNIKKEGIVLNKTELGFENEGVLNPATILIDGEVHMFYRAVSKGNYSSIGFCKLDGPLRVMERSDIPVLFPQCEYETHGVEDPRVTKIDDTYYMSYTAYDGVNALGALAVSKDLENWHKLGLIVPTITYKEFRRLAETKAVLNEKYIRYNDNNNGIAENHGKKIYIWDKNVIFFPRRINGKLHFLHRIKPDIQIVAVENIDELTPEFWQNYFLKIEECIVLTPKFKHEVSYIGGGCPPIETEHGWVLIYHSVFDTISGYVYAACAALLDLENPQKELSRLPYVLFKPEESWELKGEVNNVCFPTGTAVFDDTLYIYYGAADERIACASLSLSELIAELLINIPNNGN
ncbi:MAG: pesticidal protein Cry7Aa [Bacteroidetes bacterium]|nr:pesticidal protein Cry7Aa [Bacteroidota bacterium]